MACAVRDTIELSASWVCANAGRRDGGVDVPKIQSGDIHVCLCRGRVDAGSDTADAYLMGLVLHRYFQNTLSC